MVSDGAPKPPNTASSPLQIFGYAPGTRRVLLILPSFRILRRELRLVYTVSVFGLLLSIFDFFLLHETVCSFSSAFLFVQLSISVLAGLSHAGQKFSETIFLERGTQYPVQPYFEISLVLFMHKIFEQNFY